MDPTSYVPYADRFVPDTTPENAAKGFYEIMRKRRSVRMFSDQPVSRETIEWLVRSACSAPSGANKQPWRFIAVQDASLKRQIRAAAEREEREFYRERAGDTWLADLRPLGTDEHKEFLEIAPWLLVVFKLTKGDDKGQVYYVNESVGIAVGLLLAAAQLAGLATLTHTPNPMGFLSQILGRNRHEKPYLLIPIGYPARNCVVPEFAFTRKPLGEVFEVR